VTGAAQDHRVPESDGLLESFLAQVVVDDYAAVPVADTRGIRGDPGWLGTAMALVIGVIVAAALLTARASDAERQQIRDGLAERVTALSAAVADRQGIVDGQVAEVDRLESALLDASRSEADGDRSAMLSTLAATTGLAGPGLTVTLDDARDAQAGSLNTVLDRDLQDIVNALWQMGAVGVALNGERLTSDTAIRSAGGAILVNYQPLSHPYRVSAVGPIVDSDGESGLQRLLARLTADYGLVTDVTAGDIALPAGELRLPRYAVPAEGGSRP
jgi:uncharacterized protein YlxW (UPF0749 family)